MKKEKLIQLITALLIVGILLSVFLLYNSQKTNKIGNNSLPEKELNIDLILNFKEEVIEDVVDNPIRLEPTKSTSISKYTNEVIGLAFSYPNSWHVVDRGNLLDLIYYRQGADPTWCEHCGMTLQLRTEENTSQLSPQEYTNKEIEETYSIYGEKIFGTIDGYSYFEGEVVNSGMGTLYRFLIFKEDSIIHLSAEGRIERDELRKIYSTIELR